MLNDPPPGAHVTYNRQYRRCHKPGCARCAAEGLGHGPYWFAYWREAGKVRSRYLGKEAPPGARGDAEPAHSEPAVALLAAGSWLRVHSLGRFQVVRGGTPVPAEAWRRRSVLMLFTCLLSASGHRLHREQVIDALWPEADLPVATRELHRALHALRTIVDRASDVPSALRLEGEMLVLAPARIAGMEPEWLDADSFERAAAVALEGRDLAACRTALACYHGDYLPDDPYSEWVSARRAELQSQYLELLLHLGRLSGSAGNLEEAEQSLRLVLQQDACQEDAAATLMGMLASAGRRIDALRIYQALASALETTMDLAPNGEIEGLRARLQAQESAPVAAALPPQGGWPDAVGNLPAPLTSFVGRAWEQGEIVTLIVRSRLVTLTGPGGCGKTRLALEVAGRLHEQYPDGIWLVELAALQDAALVPKAVAATLGTLEEMKGLAEPALVSALSAFLRPRRALLLLDNCEHLLGASAALATALLRASPGLAILATSREALRISGETVWLVPPLAVPASDEAPLANLQDNEAVRLFVDRARASSPGFTLVPANVAVVLQICRRLDGLPLALELAAARLGTMSVDGVAARLHDCFALLTGGNRTALPRQQTLRATLDWSYSLLQETEQVLLRRLAVFAGGWTLEAAVAVCHDADVGDSTAVTRDLLGELAARSLVFVVEQHGAPRYSLLETTRQYTQERLTAAGELPDTRARHRRWYLDQLTQAGAAVRTETQGAWLDRLEHDLANLRVSLASTSQHPMDTEAVLQRAEPIAHLGLVRGHIAEGKRWILAALAGDGGTPGARALALNAAGSLASAQGEYRQAIALYKESHSLFTVLGDARGAARALINHGIVMKYQGEPVQARELCEAGCQLAREHGDPALLAVALNNLGLLAIERGDTASATTVLEESLALKRRSGSQAGVIQVLVNLGEVARMGHDLPLATARYEEALALAQLQGDRLHIGLVYYNLALVAAAQDQTKRATDAFRTALKQEQVLGNTQQIAANLEGLAGVALRLERPDQAGRMLGAAEHMREQIGAPVPEVDRPAQLQALARVRDALGATQARVAWSEGRAMDVDAAIAEAMTVGDAREVVLPRTERRSV
jgi:predicted ATPase/DNA-binding SARP family transcriptional activator